MNHYLTPTGLEKIKKELEELKTKRQEIASRIEEAKGLGDLSENAEYTQAREAQSFNEGRIAEIEEILKNAVTITHQPDGTITLGCTVEIENASGRKAYTIVGSEEANPREGRISNESPLGKALLGRRAGETVTLKTPSGPASYNVVSIN